MYTKSPVTLKNTWSKICLDGKGVTQTSCYFSRPFKTSQGSLVLGKLLLGSPNFQGDPWSWEPRKARCDTSQIVRGKGVLYALTEDDLRKILEDNLRKILSGRKVKS